MKTVKRMIAAVLLLALLALALVGCSSPPPEKHTPVYSDAIVDRIWSSGLFGTPVDYSSLDDPPPAEVLPAEDRSYTVTIDGVTYNGTCRAQPGLASYTYKDAEKNAKFTIRGDNTLTDFNLDISVIPVGKKIPKDECVNKGYAILEQLCDLSKYTPYAVKNQKTEYNLHTYTAYEISFYKMIGDFQTPEGVKAYVREDGLFYCLSSTYMDRFPDDLDMHGLTIQAVSDELFLAMTNRKESPTALNYLKTAHFCPVYINHIVMLKGGKYAIECFGFLVGEVDGTPYNYRQTLFLVLVE